MSARSSRRKKIVKTKAEKSNLVVEKTPAHAVSVDAPKPKRQDMEELDPVFLTQLDRYLFGEGRNYKIYQKMGAHPAVLNGKRGMHFAVWAPHAKAVAIVCDRNGWDVEANYMLPLEDSGIYEGFIENMGYDELYKFAIHTQRGEILYKADPYGFSAEYRPGTASKTADVAGYP
jgi:1,4-alpha-glucan branching enzyme